ncbi:MAG: hypothetical protein RBT75_12210 [Anaerolineae bacterium]|nr:hypothetical protein [Anaerolineae bacterium]
MDVAIAVRHRLKWVVVVGVLMLTVFSSSTVGVLSEASDGVAKVSVSVIAKRENKATTLPEAQYVSLPAETAAAPMPILATPEVGDSLSRPHREQIDWPCWLPEGCEELYLEKNPISASSEYTNSVTAMPTARLESQDEDAEPDWRRRYDIYQQLITEASEPLLQLSSDAAPAQEDESGIRLLHGRADVQNNAEHILAEGRNHPDIPPVLVAAAIAEQASDVERLFGVDALEKAGLVVPGLENMSIGIAQLRPEEALKLGLGDADLFDPETAIQGMFAKVHLGNMRITELENPADPLTTTERYMLLSLAQNGTSEVDEYFALGGDWESILTQGNNARVMRYFLVHLDWLLLNGWELPEDVALDTWRETVFSTP